MTHEERAQVLVSEYARTEYEGYEGAAIGLRDLIARGMAEASNAELERRRAVEAERDQWRRIFRDDAYLDSTWLRKFLEDKFRWSANQFGPGMRTKGIIAHIKSELEEIEADPFDLMEWVDVVMLATDGFWRAYQGKCDLSKLPWDHEQTRWMAACELIRMMLEKHQINVERKWPAPTSEDEPSEHVR